MDVDRRVAKLSPTQPTDDDKSVCDVEVLRKGFNVILAPDNLWTRARGKHQFFAHVRKPRPGIGFISDRFLDAENAQRPVIEMLQDIREAQIVHQGEAATKEDVDRHGEEVVAALERRTSELEDVIRALSADVRRHSFRHRATAASVILMCAAAVAVVLNLMGKPFTAVTPWPEFALGTSIAFYVMARVLPRNASGNFHGQ